MSQERKSPHDRRGAFFGRRIGRKLRPRQVELFATLLPRLELDLTQPAPALGALFPRPMQAFVLEIGFGGGEHLLHEAANHPATGFIGCEPYQSGMAKALAVIAAERLDNIRLHAGDALMLIEWLPERSLDRIDLLYPDPWPKRRHWKRRFVSTERIESLARVLKVGGELRFATDVDSYAEWTLWHFLRSPVFEWTAERADDWRVPFPGFPGTRYEAKAIAGGERPTYLRFRRV